MLQVPLPTQWVEHFPRTQLEQEQNCLVCQIPVKALSLTYCACHGQEKCQGVGVSVGNRHFYTCGWPGLSGTGASPSDRDAPRNLTVVTVPFAWKPFPAFCITV